MAEAEVGEDISGQRRGPRRRIEDIHDIPRVKDTTGEKVTESFASFLEECVPPTNVLGRCADFRFTEQIALPDTPASSLTNNAPRPTADENRFYIEQIKAMKEFELTTLYVDFGHLLEREEVLARAIQQQYYRSAQSYS